jgi:hypothetical protein
MTRRNRQRAHLAGARPRCVPERSPRSPRPTTGDTGRLGAKGFTFALLLGATTYSSAACLLLNIGLILFSRTVVYHAQILIVLGIAALARKIAAQNSQKMKRLAVVGINGSWNHRRNRSAHILDMVDIESGSVVDFEIIQRVDASGRGNYEGSSHGMEWKWKR